MLFAVRINVVRFGMELARVGLIWFTRFRARSNVRSRGESGKLERTAMSLSVRSIASCP